MNRVLVGRVLSLVAVSLAAASVAIALAAPAAIAQPAKRPPTRQRITADFVAGRVQAFYDQTRDVQAGFYQTYFNKLYNRYDRSEGRVTFKKPGKMRWDYAQPNGKVIISDGERIQVYEPGDPGQPGQVIDQQMNQSQLPAALSFLMGTARLADDFTFRLLDARQQGFAQGHVLELRPKTPQPTYDRIVFYVDSTPARAGVVHRVLIIDAAGNRNRFDFSNLQFNRNVPDTTFRWSPPAGTRRVQP